jgi:hypothetical protein
MNILRIVLCPEGCGEMWQLRQDSTFMHPNGFEHPTWWCSDCGTFSSFGISGNQISLKSERKSK